MGPCPQNRISSRLVSLLGSAPFKKPGPSADFEKVIGGMLPKRDTNLELILFWGQGPKIYMAKTRSCKRLLSKGLFYIRAMVTAK